MANGGRTTEYGSQSISSLKGAERVRKRPAVIFGSDGLEGCEHTFIEILANSVDEFIAGYGKQINVTVFNDHSIQVEDFGRGVPLDWNENEQRYNWELVYCELYAGGKYSNDKNSAYEMSQGLNGLGACATQYSSEYMEVTSYTKGTKYSVSFKKGEPVTELMKEACPKSRTGTVQRWKPDIEVFTDINIPREYFRDVMKLQSVVNGGLKLTLKWQNEDGSFDSEEFCYENGLRDYMDELVGVNYITEPVFYSADRRGRDREDQDEYDLKMEFGFCFSNDVQLMQYFHNAAHLQHGGSPDKACRTAFLYGIDKYLKDNNKYKAKEAKITFADIEDSLVFISNSFSSRTSYENQTKKAITNTFITSAMTEYLKHCLEVYFIENPQCAEKIANQILVNRRSREQSENVKINAKKKLTTTLDVNNSVEKFVNCRSKDPSVTELYIVEGDSAMTSCILARDPDFQAIIPVRGKTLNCLKSTFEKILANDIITDLLKIIGCGIEFKGRGSKEHQAFDRDKLRWSKIILCTDADEDGYQIRALLLSMLFKLLPSLIKEGLVYIAETPLYEIKTKNDTYFAYNEKEKAEILSKLGDAKYIINRSKGLGENNPDMMSRTTMHPATRRLLQVKMDDEEKTVKMFDILMGDRVEPRKEFIEKYGAKYLPMADY